MECHGDLSAAMFAAKGRSDISDWTGLHSKKTENPPAGAGIQIDGYFPDDSTTNTTYGWNHDSQFVIRLPENWNGQLVVTGAPGVRKQYARDHILSDWSSPRATRTPRPTRATSGRRSTKTGHDPRRARRCANGTTASPS